MKGVFAVVRLTVVVAFTVCMVPSCGDGDAPQSRSEVAPAAAAAPGFSSTTFAVPLDIESVPDWLPVEPTQESTHFITWTGEGEWIERAVRFLVPVDVYQPGAASASALPDDYLGFLRSQTQYGARFADEVILTVGGRPATMVTATTSTSLDGSLGCPDAGAAAMDCFGVQPDLALRLAILDVDGSPLLLWTRAANGADNTEQFADFERMLEGVTFRD